MKTTVRKATSVVALTTALVSGALVGGVTVWSSIPPVPADRSTESVIEGGYASWQVQEECSWGPIRCVRVLAEVNERLEPVGVEVFEDGSMSRRGE